MKMVSVENYFLIVLALVWIIVAVVQDFRKREIANWWNFSLIAVALSYRAFVSVMFGDYRYLLFGLAGFGVFFILANLFYYGRVFAGGDAKLLMALGSVLPFSLFFYENLEIFLYFLVLLLFCGGIYGLFFSIVLSYKNRQKFGKEFAKQFSKNKRIFYIFIILAILLLVFVLFIGEYILIWLSFIVLVFPFLYVYAKAIEENCMIKSVKSRDLTVGDWLCEEVKVRGGKIKPSWSGLSERELLVLKKLKRKVLVREGIPFTPAFLFAFIVLALLRYSNWSFWQVF